MNLTHTWKVRSGATRRKSWTTSSIALAADYLPQFDGRYGWPPAKSMEVMYYNQDWLEELGYDGPPETVEELRRWRARHRRSPILGAIAR